MVCQKPARDENNRNDVSFMTALCLTLGFTGLRIILTIDRVPFECLTPRMERLEGETGASPVLSRNCDEGIPLSQVARSKAFTTLSLKGGGDFGLATAKLHFSPPWHHRREVLL